MLIIADSRIPEAAQQTLKQYGTLIPFKTQGITYEAVSGHPDVFMTRVAGRWILAPNIPQEYVAVFKENVVDFAWGELTVGAAFPDTARYNVVATDSYLLHNFRYTDSIITRIGEDLDLIHVNQGYTRCNLLPLNDNCFITSDAGIQRVLSHAKLDSLLVNPDTIHLPGAKHGFFGGCCGIDGDRIFVIGSLDSLPDGETVRNYLKNLRHSVIELYEGPLFDGGSLFFLDPQSQS